MNTKLTSLIVLGAIAMTVPAFAADSATATATAPAPAKTAKISSPKTASKVKTHISNKKKAAVTLPKKAK